MMKEKLSEIKAYLKNKKIDALIVFTKSPNFSYLISREYEHGIIIITREKDYLFLSPLHSPKLKHFKIIKWSDFEKDFSFFVKRHKIRRVATDYDYLLVKQKSFLKKYFKISDCSKLLTELRQLKTDEEISRIKQACRITDNIFKSIIKNFNFRTEADIIKHIKMMALQAGVDLAFNPIVASGKNAVIAHHNSNSKLKKGFLVLDFGVKYKGYLSDMTRTIYLGVPSEKEILLYEKILSIQKSCIQKARIGMKVSELFSHAIKLFGDDSKYFIHGLGHGLGVEIHEKPNICLKSKDKLKDRSIFTIEPGYYNKAEGVGIRIEDDILFLNGKKEILTHSSKDLICIKI